MDGTHRTVAALCLIAACVAEPAWSQSAAAPPQAGYKAPAHPEEIVVTALKRRQRLQDVPAAVSVLTGRQLDSSGITSSFDLQKKIPGLDISYSNRETNVAIRGVSNNVRSLGADPDVAVHLNGVYLPQSSMVLTDLFDISRVEVLKGPEGTLYGRNATAGAINFIPNEPIPGYSAQGYVGAGSLDLFHSQVALNAGTDKVAGRVSLDYDRDSGFTNNIYNGTKLDTTDYRAFRGQVKWHVSDDVDVLFFAQDSFDRGNQGYFGSGATNYQNFLYPYEAGDPTYNLTSAVERTGPRDVRLDAPVINVRNGEAYSATVNWNAGPVTVKSISAGTYYLAHDANDSDATASNLESQVTHTNLTTVSQEFQVSGTDKSLIDWTSGLYLYHDSGEQFFDYEFHGINCLFIGATTDPCPFAKLDSHNSSFAAALFGQALYKFAPQWAFLLGARGTIERKTGHVDYLALGTSADAGEHDSAFTPKGQLQWRPSPDLLVYAGISRGFKAGGIAYTDRSPSVFKPEYNTDYEIGFKSTLLQQRLILDASAFHYDYRDLQLKAATTAADHRLQFITANVGSAEIDGLDVDTAWRITPALQTTLAGEYLYTSIGRYLAQDGFTGQADNLEGSPLPLSPRLTVSVGVDYRFGLFGGELATHADYDYKSKAVFPATYDALHNYQGAYFLLDATARWTAPSGAYYLEFIGRNLTNKLYLTSQADYAFSNVVENYGAPFTAEVRLGFKL